MNIQEAIAPKFSAAIPGTNTMTSVLPKTLLSNAADIASPNSAQANAEGLVCDRGDESGVGCTMAG